MNKILATAAALALSTAAQANLVVNGGFEDTVVSPSKSWQAFNSIAGWSTNPGATFELWSTHGLKSYEGDQHLELNSTGRGAWSIWQDIDTVSGVNYTLSFVAASRRKNGESFLVEIFNSLPQLTIQEVPFDGQTNEEFRDLAPIILQEEPAPAVSSTIILDAQKWVQYSYDFTAGAPSTRIQFTSISPGDTLGNLIDDVKVVPVPSTLSLLAFALLGLSRRRRAL